MALIPYAKTTSRQKKKKKNQIQDQIIYALLAANTSSLRMTKDKRQQEKKKERKKEESRKNQIKPEINKDNILEQSTVTLELIWSWPHFCGQARFTYIAFLCLN